MRLRFGIRSRTNPHLPAKRIPSVSLSSHLFARGVPPHPLYRGFSERLPRPARDKRDMFNSQS